jgi:hypothetical protein
MSGEEDLGEGGAEVPKLKPHLALSEASRKTVLLANRRASARRALQFAVGRLHGVLAEQRRFYEERFPPDDNGSRQDLAVLSAAAPLQSAAQPPQDNSLANVVEEAYKLVDERAASLRTALELLRRAECASSPLTSFVPAVVAFSVSAPGSTWAYYSFQSQGTPLPRVVKILESLFLAAYSNSVQLENRPKKRCRPRVAKANSTSKKVDHGTRDICTGIATTTSTTTTCSGPKGTQEH